MAADGSGNAGFMLNTDFEVVNNRRLGRGFFSSGVMAHAFVVLLFITIKTILENLPLEGRLTLFHIN
jgi:hypothetical protein